MFQVEIFTTDSSSDQINPVTVLQGNYPNPFNPETTISFSLAAAAPVELVIFNVKGEKVRTLIKSRLNANNYNVVWDGRDEDNRKLAGGYDVQIKSRNIYS